MPWELVSRLRRRQPTPQPQQEPSAQVQLDRRILQNPSSFLDHTDTQDPLPLGLTPSTRLPRCPERAELPPAGSQSRFTIASGGGWSTFGRKRGHQAGEERSRSPSTFTLSPPLPDAHEASSPTSSISSKRHPQTPQRRSSVTNPGVDSPHTFGHPTPPDNPVDMNRSPPPPLPPLDHPQLRRPGDRSSTTPRVMAEQHETLGRTRTVSTGRRRRSSADWSSHQASVGQAWPAQVSREILRLSLRGSDLPPGSDIRTRGGNTDPGRRPNRGVMSPSFLPFPHPSRPNSPPPSTASATLADSRVVVPVRPHSLQFDLGTSRGSQRKSTMVEVKRSLSAIEPRNGVPKIKTSGAVYTSLGSSDPASQAPQASQLLHPAFALTPSRLPPSDRVFPTPTPMASSMQGEPSTPTPAPRHTSDKSRGKRKAEDNIDLTPPEQKKEGQRATFLLPAETRSQRVSNASHAPSSYHRKRARLSSASPFATPVQSRPSSVQETPRSANRNPHFASLSSSTGARIAPSRTPSRAASTHSRQPPTPSTTRKHERRQSMSQISIPISAIVSPHAPSISRSTKFHMRDPRRPPKKPKDTPWGLRFATEDELGSPIQAWCFFLGFLLFPVWWIAGLFLRVPKTRIAGDADAEKCVAIDDPQIERDARIWRFRCRVMAVVSLFTYIPFIVLVAIFAPR